jgi:hypothetical protein
MGDHRPGKDEARSNFWQGHSAIRK